ncbi:hypothetical protein [Nonomuraea typhae]|uniref:hypothetical protein n=1 Tax=Nonomuraea typhae TaxID=2603600 RepID=UPI0012FB1FBC|nr:hypothetical protein [Nonomuraea typhae]
MAFTVPAAVFWGSVTMGVAFLVPRPVIVWAAVIYTVAYAVAQVLALPLRAPGRSWQVPSQWLVGRSFAVRTAIWGMTLGPGVMTRNAFAGSWLFPLLAAASAEPLVMGAASGALHAAGRVAGIMRQMDRKNAGGFFDAMARTMRWRTVDGVLLSFLAGLLIVFAGYS